VKPSSKEALPDYFVHQAQKLSIRGHCSIATIACHYILANIFLSIDDEAEYVDDKGNTVRHSWVIVQKAIADQIQSNEGLKDQLFNFVLSLSDEDLKGICRVGSDEQCAYSDDESFISDIDWTVVKENVSNCWVLVSMNS